MLSFYILLAAVILNVVTCEPGSCPPTLSVDICEAVCSSNEACNGNKLCCPTVCGGAMCVDPMTKRHFTTLEHVPPPLIATPYTRKDTPLTIIRHMFHLYTKHPQVSPEQTLRLSIDGGWEVLFKLVKKGRCPEYPRGPWVCSHTCTSDSDCPRTLKCCPNRCGALTCQKPDPDEPIPNVEA